MAATMIIVAMSSTHHCSIVVPQAVLKLAIDRGLAGRALFVEREQKRGAGCGFPLVSDAETEERRVAGRSERMGRHAKHMAFSSATGPLLGCNGFSKAMDS